MSDLKLESVESNVEGCDFQDLAQDYRYIEPPEVNRLILALPVTSFRPEAMRVSQREIGDGRWFEVETFSPRQNRWIAQKEHSSQEAAVADANGWYPAPALATKALQCTDDESMSSLPNAKMHLNLESWAAEVVHDGKTVSFGEVSAINSFADEMKLNSKDVERLRALDTLGTALGTLESVGMDVPVVDHGRYIGPILAVRNGLAIQNSGRGKLVAHDTSKFEKPPKGGDKLDVNYVDGLVKAAKEFSQDGHSVSVSMHVR